MRAADPPPEARPRLGLKGRRILIIHSEPLVAAALADRLLEEGCEVVGPASTLQHALASVAEPNLDAAVLNYVFAGGNTLSLAERLRCRSVPLVFFTAMEPTYMAEVAASMGALFLRAPEEVGAIPSAIAGLLGCANKEAAG
jgi:DNA-binding response OmpR family regulator